MRRIAVLGTVFVLLAVLAPHAVAREHGSDQGTACFQSSTGAVPIPDLGEATYGSAQGGLYPGGSNTIPTDHEAAGQWHASQIEPLDGVGNPDPDGAIAVVSLGVSNTWREFQDFMAIAEGNTAPAVVLVNGAQAGEPIAKWVDPQGRTWANVDAALSDAGVSADQVQAAWVKIPERIMTFDELEPFPVDAQTYQAELVKVLRIAKDRYPNLHIAYLSSRIYGGYSESAAPSPEPLSYENGFGVKWVVEQQINGAPELNHDATVGTVEAPWLAWGPYLWADGIIPRADGLTWECSDFRRDGTHPTSEGIRKVGTMLAEHFLSAPTAVGWFTVTGEPVEIGELPPISRDQGVSPDRSTDPGSDRRERDANATERPSTTAIDEGVHETEALDQPESESEGRPSSNPSSLVLIVAVIVLGLGLVAGVGLIVVSRRRDQG
ncbi:MAG: hypothetical protein ABFR53_01135 [Actinomycetota bacterium]